MHAAFPNASAPGACPPPRFGLPRLVRAAGAPGLGRNWAAGASCVLRDAPRLCRAAPQDEVG